MAHRKGDGKDELFMGDSSASSSSNPPPNVEPLRINKRSSQQSVRRDSLPFPSPMGSEFAQPLRRPTYPAAGPAGLSGSPQPQYADNGQQPQTLGVPYSSVAGPTGTLVNQPTRHVSVVHGDEYPTPPAFKHRDGTVPARLRSGSHSASPPPVQQFQPPPQVQIEPQELPPHGSNSPTASPAVNPFPQFHQQYWPPPSRMTSTSTTAARRGSPPPPETPATPAGDQLSFPAPIQNPLIAGRRGTPGAGAQGRNSPRLNSGPHQLPASQPSQESQTPPRRPWTPTESPGSYPHGPPTVWHGTGGQNSEENLRRTETPRPISAAETAPEPLEQDFQRMNIEEPPPSYASLSHVPPARSGSAPAPPATTAQGYPDEKRTVVIGAHAAEPDVPVNHAAHPAFHNDPPPATGRSPRSQTGSPVNAQGAFPPDPQKNPAGPGAVPQQHFSPPPPMAGPSSPPPLPEGWIAHPDPNSGQFYYIHVASSHTQWDPPTADTMVPGGHGVVPQTPMVTSSPANSYANHPPLGSPTYPPTNGFPPPTDSSYGPTTMMASPPMTTMSTMPSSSSYGYGPPPPAPVPIPIAGITTYKIAPVNQEYFGPYLRYTNMDIERGIWLGSIMIVTEYQQSPTVHIHKSRDLSPNPRQLKAVPIYTHKTWAFYRYDIDLQMDEISDMWTYAVSTPLGCTRFEFLTAGRYERGWRFIAHSCNDFSLHVKGEERAKLGGHGFMWKDLMQKHLDCGGFHAQIGSGDQIYADRMWKEVQPLKEWLEIKGKENRKNAQWTTRHEDEIMHAYFHYYTSSWDMPHIREAFAQIPYMFQLDDHDIFDGFGSYPEYMQFSNIFKNIGRIGIQWYLLFQHHTTVEMAHARPDDLDIFTVTGTGWHWIKYLGPAVAIVGIDTRSERNQHQVMAGPTYQGLFPKIANLPGSIQHAILVLSVPIIYPRLDTAENLANTVATGKKAVTGTFNLVGKVVGSAAGVIGAKEVVGSGFSQMKKAVGKAGLMSGVVSVFGEVDLLDDLRDHWTHESKDLERTYFIRTLQGISHSRSIRISFLSGDVHVCGAGLVHDPNKPSDHKTMYQLITSGIVNAPPPNYIIKMLHGHRVLYVPQNGLRTTNAPSDTKEDMMEVFQNEVDGRPRELKKLMGKRNYAIFTAFEGESGSMGMSTTAGKSVSIAVDFIVQGEGVYAMTGKYGPVVVPRLEPGW